MNFLWINILIKSSFLFILLLKRKVKWEEKSSSVFENLNRSFLLSCGTLFYFLKKCEPTFPTKD